MVTSNLQFEPIAFTEAGSIDNLWKYSEIQSTHRDKVRDDMKSLLDSSPQNFLKYCCLKPYVIAPTLDGNYVLPQQLPLMCFRGQSDARWNLAPSICRSKVEGETGLITNLVREMRIQEFGKMMENTTRYRQWTSLELDPPDQNVRMAKGLYFDNRSLAQHFFIPTDRLDLTNDVEVALFFACTKYEEGGGYRPITEDDIKECKQGSIFTSLLLNCAQSEDFKGVSMIPIQPYVRPAMQSGFAFIQGSRDTDLGISRFVFDHDPVFSEYICKKFDYGKKLFDEKGAEWIPKQVKCILESHSFSTTAFKRACRHLRIDHKELKGIQKEMESHGNYQIGRNAYSLSDDSISKMEPDWNIYRYMSEIGMDTRLLTLKTAYGDRDGKVFFTNDRPLAGIIGMIRALYMMEFKSI